MPTPKQGPDSRQTLLVADSRADAFVCTFIKGTDNFALILAVQTDNYRQGIVATTHPGNGINRRGIRRITFDQCQVERICPETALKVGPTFSHGEVIVRITEEAPVSWLISRRKDYDSHN
jgi:hypothetical protein